MHPLLDALIALVLIYALLSVLVSILLEAWNQWTKERGVYLQRAIFRMLDDPLNHNFGFLLYQHPIISGMRRDGNSLPHYISSEAFANALIDVIAERAATMDYVEGPDGHYHKQRNGHDAPLDERFLKGVSGLKDSTFKRMMDNFIGRNGGQAVDLDRLKGELGRWFDDQMARTGGQYKNDQRGKLRWIGLLVALGLNVDSLHLVHVVVLDQDLRDRLVEQADHVAAAYTEEKRSMDGDALQAGEMLAMLRRTQEGQLDSAEWRSLSRQLEAMAVVDSTRIQRIDRRMQDLHYVSRLANRWQIPIGWHPSEAPLSWITGIRLDRVPPEFPPGEQALLKYHVDRNKPGAANAIKWVLGIFITAISLSFGAPFWFELLVKLVNIRRSGGKPKSHEED